jgi:hypothetical protein
MPDLRVDWKFEMSQHVEQALEQAGFDGNGKGDEFTLGPEQGGTRLCEVGPNAHVNTSRAKRASESAIGPEIQKPCG